MFEELLLVILTVVFFVLVRQYITPTIAIKAKVPNETVSSFVSYFGSFTHASLSSALALSILYATPEVFSDFSIKSPIMNRACCFTIGYFIFDTYDMLFNQPNSQIEFEAGTDNLGMTVHHLVPVAGLSYLVITQNHLSLFYSAIFIEVNSIFMHLRQLMKFAGCKRSIVMDYTTLITHLIFRQLLAINFVYSLYTVALQGDIGIFVYYAVLAFVIIEAGNLMLLRELISDIWPNRVTVDKSK